MSVQLVTCATLTTKAYGEFEFLLLNVHGWTGGVYVQVKLMVNFLWCRGCLPRLSISLAGFPALPQGVSWCHRCLLRCSISLASQGAVGCYGCLPRLSISWDSYLPPRSHPVLWVFTWAFHLFSSFPALPQGVIRCYGCLPRLSISLTAFLPSLKLRRHLMSWLSISLAGLASLKLTFFRTAWVLWSGLRMLAFTFVSDFILFL